MPPSYLDQQILTALQRAKGNQTKARSILAEMAAEDEKLLRALFRPHMQAIIAHAINRVATAPKTSSKKSDDESLPKISKKAGQIDAGFGLDLLKALGGPNVAKFGKENSAPPMRKKEASKDHVAALKLMAAKSKTKPVK
jgi:hypothetical protein